MHGLINIFSNKSLVKVLSLFLTNTDEEFYQSKIVERTSSGLIQVQRALKRLESSELIIKYKSGNRSYYRANKNHPAFEDIKKALFKTILFGDRIKEAFKPFKHKIEYSFIYGSVASGKELARSDIDLFIVGDVLLKEIAKAINMVSQELGKEINPTIYSHDHLLEKLKEENTFVHEVIGEKKIWLIGEESEFNRL